MEKENGGNDEKKNIGFCGKRKSGGGDDNVEPVGMVAMVVVV